MFEPKLEGMPRERLRGLQLERLRWTLGRVALNWRYGAHVSAAPAEVRSLDMWLACRS